MGLEEIMKTIVLVGCGKDKLSHPAKVKDMYTGPLFKKARAYAERIGDSWWILSAKYGLLGPDEKIEPYDETLAKKPKKERHWWNVNVRNSISCNLLQWIEVSGPNVRCVPAKFVCLAGEPYLEFFEISPEIRKCCIIEKPLAGMGIGQRLQFLSLKEKRRA